ncbi:MAG: pilin [Candidatus Magasanikbacteria bacterium]|jgi:hypothetical protein
MKKLILLIVVLSFVIVKPARAESFELKCTLLFVAAPCYSFSTSAEADNYKKQAEAKGATCTVTSGNCGGNPANPAPAPTSEQTGICVCEKECKQFSYKDSTEWEAAKTACGLPTCNSKYPFKDDATCTVPSKVHCDCGGKCTDKEYVNTMESLKVVEDFCSGAECKSTGGVLSGACPTAGGGATPDNKSPDFVTLDNPLALVTDVKVIIGTVIKGLLGIMGGLVLLMVVWGGTTWLTAAGNPEKVKAGSQTILWALLGAIITTASYIILNTVMKLFL